MNNITIEKLRNLGIHEKDPRFPKDNNNENIQNNFMSKLDKGKLEINNWAEIKEILTDTYNEVRDNNKGYVADYIQLSIHVLNILPNRTILIVNT